jgi:hypothetical protein
MSARVLLVGKPNCHLCDVAKQVVETVCAEFGIDPDEINIHEDPFSAAEYADRIPVVLVAGEEISHFRISAEQLRKALADA